MTLATVGPDGAPAAAAVFYAHDDALNLYFLSEERTQHGQNMLAQPAGGRRDPRRRPGLAGNPWRSGARDGQPGCSG